jgi:hypothetical protein
MRALAPLAALSLAACGGLAADVEIERFCYTTPVSGIPGAPAPLPAGTALGSAIPVALPLPPLLRAKGEVTVRLEDATIAAVTAGADLSGIVRLSVEEQPASGPPVVLARYVRPASTPVPLRAIVAGGQGVDIVQAVRAGTVNVLIVAEGQAPAAAWNAEITLCAYGKSKINYF